MAPLVVLVLWVRRAARLAAPLAGALALGALAILDAASPLPPGYAVASAAGVAALLFARAKRRAQAIEGSVLADLELGVLLVVAAVGAAAHLDGSLDGRFFPAVFVAIALTSAFARPSVTAAVIVFAAGLEAAIRAIAYGEAAPLHALPHLGFLIVFAALNAAVLRGELARIRSASRARLDAEISRL